MKKVLSEIEPCINKKSLLVTLNGSITFEMIQKKLDHKIAKVIPSVMAEINRSQTIVCYNDMVEHLLLGRCDKDGINQHLGE